MKKFFGFNNAELRLLQKLNTPQKIQDYLNRLPINFEEQGDTSRSPREVLRLKTAHCMEGALLAAVALWYHGQKPLLLDLVTTKNDDDHVVALFRQNRLWGAISKTNHAVLRYREPVYKTVRELAMSYFHEYFKDSGHKTLRKFSRPFDLSKIKDKSWMTSTENLWEINNALEDSFHYNILRPNQARGLRKADPIEIEAGKIIEWQAKGKSVKLQFPKK
ncbi:hypothetical protein IPM19_03935 [bacterium]|nr:MAG: hypothetical protein IPM19_03935 [bacterium]